MELTKENLSNVLLRQKEKAESYAETKRNVLIDVAVDREFNKKHFWKCKREYDEAMNSLHELYSLIELFEEKFDIDCL